MIKQATKTHITLEGDIGITLGKMDGKRVIGFSLMKHVCEIGAHAKHFDPATVFLSIEAQRTESLDVFIKQLQKLKREMKRDEKEEAK